MIKIISGRPESRWYGKVRLLVPAPYPMPDWYIYQWQHLGE